MIDRYLEDLEQRLDPDVEEKLLSEWQMFCDGRFGGDIFSPRRARSVPPGLKWPKISINESLDDLDAMLLQQFGSCSDMLAQGSGGMLNIRANYGTGILPSVFGAEIVIMDPSMNTLPSVLPIEGGGADAMRRMLKRGVPDIGNGYGSKVLEAGRIMRDAMRPYPKISRYVHMYHPDFQGPMDVCELLWGSDIFLDIIDDPGLVHEVLSLVTETYGRLMRIWLEIAPPVGPYSCHWGFLIRGQIAIRDDSAMNFSPEMFGTFIKPYDQKLLNEFGGGIVHFCGRGSHYIDQLATYEGLSAVHMTQPSYNEMEIIYRNTVDRGLLLPCFDRSTAEDALRAGRKLHGLVHCW